MSTSELTLWAAIVAGASVLLLMLIDRRKPARRRNGAPRAPLLGNREVGEAPVTVLPATLYRRPPLYRRLIDVVGLAGMAVILGGLLAVLTGFALFALLALLDRATG